MSFEIGGRADKLGNRYEGRWVAKQLLRLLNEEISSVTIEAIGDDEHGVDLWIVQNNGVRQAQQCKSRNKSKDTWSISELKTRDILNKFLYQLDRHSQVEFKFVSGIPFTSLADICDSARNSNQDSESFYMNQINGASRKKIFNQFCEGMILDSDDKYDRKKAFDYLRRLRIDCYSDDETSWCDLKNQASFLITGAPETIIAVLCSYAENSDRLGAPIYADELWQYLKEQNMFPKKLIHDQRIMPCIKRLQKEFENSIRPGLIAGKLIPREEAVECINLLQNGKGFIILHGSAGLGKSGILFEVVKQLQLNGNSYIPFRLDRRIPEKNAAQYGNDAGLPDSPVNCLSAVAGGRSCVLILDQLDAIRWTSAHSSNSLDVCREIINEVATYRREGKNISVIITCRTFDLKHDPEIKQLIEAENRSEKWEKIEVCPLQTKVVKQIVGEHFTILTERQKGILAVPQNLAMWTHLKQEEQAVAFKSNVELMKMFWKSKRTALAELANIGNINEIIDNLSKWMEEKGKISAPAIILSPYSSPAIYAIKSHGIIQEQGNTISFCHQSYLDYLIAERLVFEIFRGGSVLQWLGQKERQSLFRREQFRQALSRLADEDSETFSSVAKEVLSSDNVRFHMKYVVLEIIGQLDDLDNIGIVEYVLELYKDSYWHKHVLETIFYGNKAWVLILIAKKLIAAALCSDEIEKIQESLHLLRSVLYKIPNQVAFILTPYIGTNDVWSKRVLDTIDWDATKDSDAIFEMRVSLAEKGFLSDFIDWKELCEKNGIRSLKLLAIFLSLGADATDVNVSHHRNINIERLRKLDSQAMRKCAERFPLETWNLLMPIVKQRIDKLPELEYDYRIWCWQKDDCNGDSTNLERVTMDSLIRAGQVLAKNDPILLLELTKNINKNAHYIMQNLLIEIYSCFEPESANIAIEWILGDVKRFVAGDGYTELEYAPAVRLIERLSPYCSKKLFDQLENKIINYHEPDELTSAKYHLDNFRKHGIYGDYWGRVQYFLLQALCKERCKKPTLELIEVLNRKYKNYSMERFMRSGSSGVAGWVGSSLNKNLNRISDHSWVEIVKNKNIPINGNTKWRNDSENKIIETSVQQFSRSFQSIAEIYPERFGRLSLNFPKDTDYRYIGAILSALALTKPKDGASSETKNEWEPASIETITKVLDRFKHYIYSDIALEFCRLVEARAEDNWPDSVLDMVAYQAIHNGTSNYNKRDTAHDLLTATINCSRGVACNAIAALLWSHKELLSRFRSVIESNIIEKDPVVLISTTNILLPILNIGKEQAVEWFSTIALKDIRVAASHYGSSFIGYTVKEFPNYIVPVIREILNDDERENVILGAHMASSFNLFYGLFTEETDNCITGSVNQRIGIAKTAVANISELKYAEKSRYFIFELMNDPEKEVRAIINKMFSNEIFEAPENIVLVENYANSLAFLDSPHWLFRYLDQYKESLVPFAKIILNSCQTIINNYRLVAEDDVSKIRRSTYILLPLLLRLYEQTQERNSDIADLCLNIWDEFYEIGIGNIRDITNGIG